MRLSASICIAVCSLAATAAHAQPAPTEARGFVEGGLGYGWAPSSGPYVEVSNGTQLASASAQGPGLDLAAGVRVVPGLFVMVDLAWSSARTIEGEDQDGDTSRTKVSATSLAIGLRTTRPLGRGRLYADLALGMVLPFESVRSEHMANGESRTTTIGYNTGTGARAEMGYQVPVSGGVYVGGGLRIEAFATDNIGRERVRVDQPSGDTETDTYTTDPDGGNGTRRAESVSLQDVRLRLDVGYRF